MRLLACFSLVLLVACGSEAPPEPEAPPTPEPLLEEAPAPEPQFVPDEAPPTPPAAESDEQEGPREIRAIWDDLLVQRRRIDELLEAEQLKAIIGVTEKMDELNYELAGSTREYSRARRISIRRSISHFSNGLERLYGPANQQVPGRVLEELKIVDQLLNNLEWHLFGDPNEPEPPPFN